MTKSTWLIGLSATGLLAAIVACSSDSGTGSPGGGGTVAFGGGGTGNKAGTGGTGTGGSATGGMGGSATGGVGGSATGGVGGGTGGTGTGGSGTGGDAGQCKTPTTLHPPSADAGTQTLYCPFSGVDGGKNDYCDTATQHCCEPKSGTASCTPKATPCGATETDWECEDPVADCPSGQVCCGSGTIVKNPDPNCANYATGFTGTHCATSCTATEITMCTSPAECTGGKTCLPFSTKGNQVGGCY